MKNTIEQPSQNANNDLEKKNGSGWVSSSWHEQFRKCPTRRVAPRIALLFLTPLAFVTGVGAICNASGRNGEGEAPMNGSTHFLHATQGTAKDFYPYPPAGVATCRPDKGDAAYIVDIDPDNFTGETLIQAITPDCGETAFWFLGSSIR